MKVAIFYVQDYNENVLVSNYDDYLQEWYDQARSFGFDKIFYIDVTPTNEVPQITSSSEFERKRYTSLQAIIDDYPSLEYKIYVAPNEYDAWDPETPKSIKNVNFPKDNFAFVFGRDTGGLNTDEIDKIKTSTYELINIPTSFGGALYSIQAATIAFYERMG